MTRGKRVDFHEKEKILSLKLEGKTNKEIAELLGRPVQTVSMYTVGIKGPMRPPKSRVKHSIKIIRNPGFKEPNSMLVRGTETRRHNNPNARRSGVPDAWV